MSGNTIMRRLVQFRDRWSSLDLGNGLEDISDQLSLDELKQIDIFAELKDVLLEKISLDVAVATWSADAVLFEEGSYIDLAFYILEGEVEVTLENTPDPGGTTIMPIFSAAAPQDEDAPAIRQTVVGNLAELMKEEVTTTQTRRISRSEIAFLSGEDFNIKPGSSERLGPGDILGEIGALSGWPQSVTARTTRPTKVVQIRLPALRQIKQKSKALKTMIDDRYRTRSLATQLQTTPLFAGCDSHFFDALVKEVEMVSCKPDEVVAERGNAADGLYLVRSGFIKLTQALGEGEMVTTYLSKGMTFGQLELLMSGVPNWQSHAISVEYAELVKIPRVPFEAMLARKPHLTDRLWKAASKLVESAGYNRRQIRNAAVDSSAVDLGFLQGNSMLVIDSAVCTRCDDCVRGCTATHDDRARFVREGDKVGRFHVARSCFHCNDPVCLVGCPTGAIRRRGASALVDVTDDVCIGCGTCARNCPYDAIVMHDMQETWPDDMMPKGLRGKERQVASKCDLCADTGHDPACVTSCPQGCAVRIDGLEELHALLDQPEKAKEDKRLQVRHGSTGVPKWFMASLLLCVVALILEAWLTGPVIGGPWRIGYGIAALVLMLAVFAWTIRRRMMKFMAKVKAPPARHWLRLHIYGGLLFQLLVIMHSGFHVPMMGMNFWLWLLSWWVTITGLAGLGLQRWLPRLMASGLSVEVLYERIPALTEDARARAAKLAEKACEPVRDLYERELAHEFAEPKRNPLYLVDITGGITERLRPFTYLAKRLAGEEREQLDSLQDLYRAKLEMDAHYTLQSVLRGWPALHLPAAWLLLILTGLHLFQVWYY